VNDDGEIELLRRAHERVLQRIVAACQRVGRDPDAVTLVAVSKTVPAARLRSASAAGLTLFGENRVQEAAAKHDLVPGVRWHLIGPLQSNKVRRAMGLFEALETLDSVELARRVARAVSESHPAEPLTVYLQVNVDRDPAKAGFAPEAVPSALPEIEALPGLRIAGLMTVGRLVTEAEEARPTFRALAMLSEQLRHRDQKLGPELSMGMTDDFEIAIEEGATLVRIGRALFGERPPER